MSTKPHIAIFSNLPSGGASTLKRNNISYFRKKKIKIDQYSGFPPSQFKNLLHYLLHVLFFIPTQHRKIANSINVSKAKIVIAYHSWITKSPFLLRLIKGKIIYICHEPPREYYDNKHISRQSWREKFINILRLPIKFIDKKNIRLAKNLLVITNSKFSKKQIDRIYGVNSKVLYPGISLVNYPSVKERKFQKSTYTIISVGAFNKLKNQEYLISSIAKIGDKSRPSLVLVGNGGNKHYIRHLIKLASKLNVSLSIKTDLSISELAGEYRQADIFAYSPIAEPFGLVILEAMAAGLPIVATKNGGGYVEILSSSNAALSSGSNEQIFSNDILSLQNNIKRRHQMSYNNLKDIKKYSSNIMNDKLWKIIKQST